MDQFDAVIVGAGAAGLFCAGIAAQRGLQVLLIDHNQKIAEKIRISGGGRCNFTNRDLDIRAPHQHFLGENPKFCRSALSRYTPHQFLALVQRYRIPFEEKHKGQLFCQNSASDLIQMLLHECGAGVSGGKVTHWHPCTVGAVRYCEGLPHPYELDTTRGRVASTTLVIATGGLSIPKIGASDFGYRVAQQFGLRLVDTRPGLVPLIFDSAQWQAYAHLAGVSLPVRLVGQCGGTRESQPSPSFDEDLLFTHKGLSGPGILQISSYWERGKEIEINLVPDINLADYLLRVKKTSKKLLPNELGTWVPSRLATAWANQETAWQGTLMEVRDKSIIELAHKFSRWRLVPSGTDGYRKAEVTVGGVDTRDLSQQTMESTQRGLYFIGEVVDITGWLGGYNFQWAWSSAAACAEALSR